MAAIRTTAPDLEGALLQRITELRHCYYAAIGPASAEVRLEYAENIRDEAMAIQYIASQLMLQIKKETQEADESEDSS